MASEALFKDWLTTDNGRDVWRECKKLALKMRRTGRLRYSINTVIQVCRWHRDIKSLDSLELKINNNWAPLLARRLMVVCPILDGFFETRTMPSLEA